MKYLSDGNDVHNWEHVGRGPKSHHHQWRCSKCGHQITYGRNDVPRPDVYLTMTCSEFAFEAVQKVIES